MKLMFVFMVIVWSNEGTVDSLRLSDEIVDTKQGKIRGVTVDFRLRELRSVTAYFGIRYASLRGKQLRFMPPTGPPDHHRRITMAIKPSAACPQPYFDALDVYRRIPRLRADFLRHVSRRITTQQEDCLTLNLYVPYREWNETKAFPVMVFLHGEAFDTGTGNVYNGSVLASFGRVIVVTVNFRLGVLGYLSMGQNKISGNYALQDIIAALHWLKENVRALGGDPGTIGMFGHGYGASLINILMVSPVNRDNRLFRRAILMSGSALAPYSNVYNSTDCFRQLISALNCTNKNGSLNAKDLIHCLKSRPLEIIVNAKVSPTKYFSCFGPTPNARSMVYPQSVKRLYQKAPHLNIKTDVLFGFTRNDAYDYLRQSDIEFGMSTSRKNRLFRTFVHNLFNYQRQKVYDILAFHYTDYDQNITMFSQRDVIIRLLSDGLFIAPAVLASRYNEAGRNFMYVFDHISKFNKSSRPLGSVHGDELAYVFGSPIVNGSEPFLPTFTKRDASISRAIITYWTNYIKSGNPNSPGQFYPAVRSRKLTYFPPFTNKSHLVIDAKIRSKNNYPSREMMALWLDLIPKMLKPEKLKASQHLLIKSHDLSTFDSPDQLKIVPGVFPPPTPKNFVSKSTPVNRVNRATEKSETTALYIVLSSELQNNSVFANAHIRSGNLQVSITIAVGSSLLFLNILIFAAVYYQRETIRRTKRRNSQMEIAPPPVAVVSENGLSSSYKHEVLEYQHGRSNDVEPFITSSTSTAMSVTDPSVSYKHPSQHKIVSNNCHDDNPTFMTLPSSSLARNKLLTSDCTFSTIPIDHFVPDDVLNDKNSFSRYGTLQIPYSNDVISSSVTTV